MAVKEWNDEIIFVRQVTPGASERSFGIQVARLAGLPDEVVGRAKQILTSLEETDAGNSSTSENEKSIDSAEMPRSPALEEPGQKPKQAGFPGWIPPKWNCFERQPLF